MRRQHGFTLLEVLVAVVVLSVMGLIAYQGLIGMAAGHQALKREADAFRDLVLAVQLLERDLRAALPREVRDELGDPEPAIAGGPRGLMFTRAGWSNPLAHGRSNLQRVHYTLAGGELSRLSWQVLDRAQVSQPRREVLLQSVERFEIEFLASVGEGEWQRDWPPVNQPSAAWPAGVRVTVTSEEHGNIERVFSLAAGAGP
ncbi:MAG: type II secretion system minor pseudopilin GspJ [Xanthomonadales bacterium]|nr:type II secretion system minor pseudopilin GspJ [Xanthomonadales bacterium]